MKHIEEAVPPKTLDAAVLFAPHRPWQVSGEWRAQALLTDAAGNRAPDAELLLECADALDRVLRRYRAA